MKTFFTKTISLFFVLFLFMFMKAGAQGKIIYVNSNANSGGNNGLSWANAFLGFQAGIDAAQSGDQVWVAEGTYQPSEGASFSMKKGVLIYGGFQGTESTLAQRNLKAGYTTLIKGNNNSVFQNNNNGLTNADTLNGFTITGGNAPRGGGMYNVNSSPTLKNIIFDNNTAIGDVAFPGRSGIPGFSFGADGENGDDGDPGSNGQGGGMYDSNASPLLINVIFSNNKAIGTNGGSGGNGGTGANGTNALGGQSGQTGGNGGKGGNGGNGGNGLGGGIYNDKATPILVNTLFYGNSAIGGNGGLGGNGGNGGNGGLGGINGSQGNGGNGGNGGIGGFNGNGNGGAIYNGGGTINRSNGVNATTMQLINVTISNNNTQYGTPGTGGAGGGAGDGNHTGHPGFKGISQPLNDFDSEGGGIFDVSGNPAVIDNSIILGNSPDGLFGGKGVHNNDLIQIGDSTSDGGVSSTTPNDVFTNFTQNDYTLKFNPATVNAGNNSFYSVSEYGDSDLAFNERIANVTIDLGPFEFDSKPVPIKMGNIKGTVNQNDHAILLWSTYTESNNKGFLVQYSTDGIHFIDGAFINSKASNGNSETTISYSADAGPVVGTMYYRLKQTDFDGAVSYSEVVALHAQQSDLLKVSIYPNPVQNKVSVLLSRKPASNARIRIISTTGDVLLHTVVTDLTNTIDLSELASGIYFVDYSDSEGHATIKVVKR